MSAVTTRPATAEDAPAIAALHRATHAEHLAMIEGYADEPWDAQITANLTDPEAEAPPFTVLVAELGGHFAGHIAMHPMPNVTGGPAAHISDISVRAGDRGYGVGRALVTAAEAEAERQGFSAALAMIWPNNKASQAFFTAMGYAAQTNKARGMVIAAKRIGPPPPAANLERLMLVGVFGLLAFIAAALGFGWLS
ncbi:GNAT family N-acetyltransferase [Vannielia litorea]|uniref:GNAT family N-acetyltransferase n=1 Tax=Vannielia litorea TaxID=1217970 RepID=UPI001C96D2B8|nr:GNAT family N-acetyltransferase [Vannielia litorea]MBY6154227.1 GNAT family N-acetyltransferase [Vannielia litorea]